MSNQQQAKSVGLGQAFGIILGTLVSIVLFVPRLIGLADKTVDMLDDVLDSGKAITTTMKESAEDFSWLPAGPTACSMPGTKAAASNAMEASTLACAHWRRLQRPSGNLEATKRVRATSRRVRSRVWRAVS